MSMISSHADLFSVLYLIKFHKSYEVSKQIILDVLGVHVSLCKTSNFWIINGLWKIKSDLLSKEYNVLSSMFMFIN